MFHTASIELPTSKKSEMIDITKRVPRNEKYYKHEEGNAHAHAKAAVVGFSETIPVQGGKPLLGTWQAIYFCEFDGPRNRKLTVTVMG
jgi:secondary thiamine-phosphate synthase enzyme